MQAKHCLVILTFYDAQQESGSYSYVLVKYEWRCSEVLFFGLWDLVKNLLHFIYESNPLNYQYNY